MKIAIFGTGRIAQKAFFPLLSSWPEVEISAVFSRTIERAQAAGRQWHISHATSDARQALESGAQAAFVLTNNESHYELSRAAMEAGLDVYVEKPAAMSSMESEELARLADARGRILMVGFNRRFAPLYRQAKDIFAGKEIGLCLAEKHRPTAFHVNLYNNYVDDTIHQIDLLRFYCGELQPVHTSYEIQNGHLVQAASLARTAEGGIATVQTCLQASSWQEGLSIHGSGISVVVSAFQSLTLRYKDHEEVYGATRPGQWLPDLVERGFQPAIAHFFDCIQTRRQPETNGWENVKTMRLIEQMVEVAGGG